MQDGGSSMPGWAAFDKDEEPPPRRKSSPTTGVVAAGVLAAAVIAGGALLPDRTPARAAASEPGATATSLPTASATPAPTLSTSPAPSSTGAPSGGLPDAAATSAPDALVEDAAPDAPVDAPVDAPAEDAPDALPPADEQGAAPAPDPAPAPAPAPALAQQVVGPLGSSVTVTVPATSPDAVDGAGQPVTYAASHLLDGRPSTAWRADGDLSGQVLTFTFDQPRELTGAGLVNGYAKVDPVTGADRYAQTRRITRVTWTVGDQQITQDLRRHDRDPQTLDFPPVTTRSVTMRIDAVTAPGDPRLDQTAISEVVLADG